MCKVCYEQEHISLPVSMTMYRYSNYDLEMHGL